MSEPTKNEDLFKLSREKDDFDDDAEDIEDLRQLLQQSHLAKRREKELQSSLELKLKQLLLLEENILGLKDELSNLRANTKILSDEESKNLEKIIKTKEESAMEPKINLSDGALREADSKITEELECPVCFEDMIPPRRIFSCSNAHLFCQRCNGNLQLKTCPKCREDFKKYPPIRNRLAERWARKIFE